MKSNLSVIKIGGNIINDEAKLNAFLLDFAQIDGHKILVHGGGKIATQLNTKLGIETIMHEGRRITSSENLDVVTMVYAGLINKKITSTLQGYNCNALGLSGPDANCILAKKRTPTPIDFGWVGDIESVNSTTIEMFLGHSIAPVFCAISHDGKGQLLNTNADTIASEIAIGMSSIYTTELIYCFEKDGVLLDPSDDSSVISEINSNTYTSLKKNQVITDGMIPKVDNCFHALQNHVSKVIIGNPQVIKDRTHCTTLTL